MQCLEGDAVWKVLDQGIRSRELFEAALCVASSGKPTFDSATTRHCSCSSTTTGCWAASSCCRISPPGHRRHLKHDRNDKSFATRFEERPEPKYPHFAWLLKAIERMIHTGRPSYPVERTLLTSGILDRVLTSRVRNHAGLPTPELAIKYEPVDYPHAPHPELTSSPYL